MVKRNSGKSRAAILEAVKTPLGFFTLGILVIEGILGALAVRASGTDFRILLVGLLVGFIMLMLMVFYLTASQKFRNALLGKSDESLGDHLSKLHLSKNDMRALVLAAYWSGDANAAAHGAALDPDAQPTEIRMKRFMELGLVEPGHGWSCLPGHVLTRDGTELANFIKQSVEAARDLKVSSPLVSL